MLMFLTVLKLVLVIAVVFSPSLCCCSLWVVPASTANAEPAKKSCCQCETQPLSARPATPKSPAPCKCKLLKTELAAERDEQPTATLSQPSTDTVWETLPDPIGLYIRGIASSADSIFHVSTSPVPGITASTQIAIISRLTC